MTRRRFLWIVLLGGVLTPLHAFAEPFAIASIPIDFRIFAVGVPTSTPGLFKVRTVDAELFSDHAFTPSDIGRTLIADATSEPDFGLFAARVTNGRPDFIEAGFGPRGTAFGGAVSGREASFFRLPNGIIDFHGFALSAVTLDLDAFSSAVRPEFPDSTVMIFNGTLSVLGSGAFDTTPTPEPASMTLFATGALAATWLRRRRQIDLPRGG